MWKRLARHNWVEGASITESLLDDTTIHRFTATIRGYQNWRIWEGDARTTPNLVALVIAKVKAIQDRIDRNDETVFKDTP